MSITHNIDLSISEPASPSRVINRTTTSNPTASSEYSVVSLAAGGTVTYTVANTFTLYSDVPVTVNLGMQTITTKFLIVEAPLTVVITNPIGALTPANITTLRG